MDLEAVGLYNTEAEAQLLGSILIEPDLIKECKLQQDHFSPGKHLNLFATMRDLDGKGIPIDFVAIVERIGNARVEKIGGISYLTELAGSIPTTANFKYHEGLIYEYWQKRKAIEAANKLKQNIHEQEITAAIQDSISDLMGIEDANGQDDDGSIKDDLINVYEAVANATEEIKGIKSGFEELDRMTTGFNEGELIIIAARPSIGKTAFALNIARNVTVKAAADNGDVVAIFSLEMSRLQLLNRMAASIGNINAQNMRTGKLTDREWTGLTMAMSALHKADLHIFDKPGIMVNEMWAKVRRLKRKYPGRRVLVVIDYLQLIIGSAKHGGNRTQEISEISRNLKHMARELEIPVIALSQLSRGVESRQDKRPIMSDIRESGQIEQDADVIGFLYRDDYYNKESENKNIIEIIIAKQRNGPVGTVQLAFIKEFGKFVNLEQRF